MVFEICHLCFWGRNGIPQYTAFITWRKYYVLHSNKLLTKTLTDVIGNIKGGESDGSKGSEETHDFCTGGGCKLQKILHLRPYFKKI